MSKRAGHFFSLPNEIFALGLSPSAFLVYSYLRRSANRNTHQCYPSYETIGSAVGLSRNTVQKCIGELADRGLIFTENTSILTKAGMKRNGNLLYTIQPVHEVIEENYQKQLRKLEASNAQCTRSKAGTL